MIEYSVIEGFYIVTHIDGVEHPTYLSPDDIHSFLLDEPMKGNC